ncbi:MAG: YkgJ family cysteine cluster protein [Candidatus Thorarchaeota archaeon]
MCVHKCCTTEYELPLLPSEAQYLKRHHPISSWLIRQSERGEVLTRGDSCIFFTRQGLCTLHEDNTKPLICKTFPLIFWKISSEEFLAWIYPCGRGSGFQWVIEPDKRIGDELISEMYRMTQDHFKSFWGEQIDLDSPFDEITIERVKQEQRHFLNLREKHLLEDLVKFGEINFPSAPFSSLMAVFNEDLRQNEFNQTVSAVLHWLSWSPVGLQLSFINAKLIFIAAALWVYRIGLTQRLDDLKRDDLYPGGTSEHPVLAFLPDDSVTPPQDHFTFPQRHIARYLGSYLATAILPSFWAQLVSHSSDRGFQSFAKVVQAVLEGRTPQQELHGFFRK